MELDNYIRGVTSSPEVKQLLAARCKAQAKFKPADKTGHNQYGRFDYATYTDLVNATLTPLIENGLGLPVCQIGKDATGEWVMVGKIMHTTGEWMSTMCPLRDQIDKNGARREDCQSFEAAVTYGQKTVYRVLLGVWFKEGDEGMEQAEEMVSQVNAEVAKAKAPAPAKAEQGYYERLSSKLKAVRSMPAEVEKLFSQAESLAESGDLTTDEMARLTKTFGALRPKKEVANAQ
jgi:hypothetical protein